MAEYRAVILSVVLSRYATNLEEHIDVYENLRDRHLLKYLELQLILWYCSASEEVFLSLFCAKCVPVLLYAVEACPVNKRTKNSFDFSINRIFMKLFRIGSVALVEDYQRFLNFLPASYQVDVETVKFLQKYKALENRSCSLFGQEADRQLRNICTVYNLPSGSSASKINKQIRSKFFYKSL